MPEARIIDYKDIFPQAPLYITYNIAFQGRTIQLNVSLDFDLDIFKCFDHNTRIMFTHG